MTGLLQHANQDDRADLYSALDVSAIYDPASRSAELTVAVPRSAKNVSEGRSHPNAHQQSSELSFLSDEPGSPAEDVLGNWQTTFLLACRLGRGVGAFVGGGIRRRRGNGRVSRGSEDGKR
jgi:hypothetical protein